MDKVIGIIPARMGSSRFPGKPLADILGSPMISHVFRRASLFPHWDKLCVATCDDVIADFCIRQGWPVIMTSDQHERPLDRVAEAANKLDTPLSDSDIVVCVQGDEPMLHPNMIQAVLAPLQKDQSVDCTVLGVKITSEWMYYSPDVVKIVADMNDDVLYTSRAPIPHCFKFPPEVDAVRIFGILAFRKFSLDRYTQLRPTRIEVQESCDSNRICGSGLKQRVAFFPPSDACSVDTEEGRDAVVERMVRDPIWGQY